MHVDMLSFYLINVQVFKHWKKACLRHQLYFMFEYLNIIKKESMSTSSIIFHVWTPEHNKERKHVLHVWIPEHNKERKHVYVIIFMFEHLNIIKKESMSTSSIIFHVWTPEHNKERKHVYVINYISCLNTWT